MVVVDGETWVINSDTWVDRGANLSVHVWGPKATKVRFVTWLNAIHEGV